MSIKTIMKWEGNTFQSSTGLTEEFARFARDFKKYLREVCSTDYDIVNFSRGHFYLSGFVKRRFNGKLAYFSISDVRHFPDSWIDNTLVRTAEHEKDYTGGSNNSCKIDELEDVFERLTH